MLLCGNKCALLLGLLLQIITIVQAEDSGSNNPFTTLLDTPPSLKPPPPASKVSSVFPVFTHLLNVFPPTEEDGSTVSLLMEEDMVGGVEYGRVDMKEAMMHSEEDFVIEFNNPNHGGMMVDAGYGFVDDVRRDEELLVIVRRSKTNPQMPHHDIIHLQRSRELSKSTSRVYIHNAICSWSAKKGLNFYGVNQTTGELVTLVTDLVMGDGQDVTLPPGTLMSVKASYVYLESNAVDLDLMQTIASTPVLSTVAGKRHYIIAYGDQKNNEGLRSTQAVLIEPPGGTRAVASNAGTRGLCGSAKIACGGILGLVLVYALYYT